MGTQNEIMAVLEETGTTVTITLDEYTALQKDSWMLDLVKTMHHHGGYLTGFLDEVYGPPTRKYAEANNDSPYN